MIVTGQLSASSLPALSTSVVATLPAIPPGVAAVTLSNVSGATVYVGTGPVGGTAPTAAVLAANGFPIPNNAPPVTLPGWPASRATQLYVIAVGSITGPMGYVYGTAS